MITEQECFQLLEQGLIDDKEKFPDFWKSYSEDETLILVLAKWRILTEMFQVNPKDPRQLKNFHHLVDTKNPLITPTDVYKYSKQKITIQRASDLLFMAGQLVSAIKTDSSMQSRKKRFTKGDIADHPHRVIRESTTADPPLIVHGHRTSPLNSTADEFGDHKADED